MYVTLGPDEFKMLTKSHETSQDLNIDKSTTLSGYVQTDENSYGSGHEGVPVLLPGFAIKIR